ncbi:MAG: hypothetical protein PUB22_00825 [Clostridiales bacterium]|nr:hypothetical protein [Clostridiales bacterium]
MNYEFKKNKWYGMVCLLLTVMFLGVGCGKNQAVSSSLVNESEKTAMEETVPATEEVVDPSWPKALEASQVDEEDPSIHYVSLDFLEKNLAYSLVQWGDRILLIGTEVILDESAAEQEPSGDWEYECEEDHITGMRYFCYLYDPLYHRLVSEMTLETGAYSMHSISGDSFIILDMDQRKLYIMDENLNSQEYFLPDLDSNGYFSSINQTFLYTSDQKLYMRKLENGVLGEKKPLLDDTAYPILYTLSLDGKSVFLTATNSGTMEEEYWVLDTADGSVLYRGDSTGYYYMLSLSGDTCFSRDESAPGCRYGWWNLEKQEWREFYAQEDGEYYYEWQAGLLIEKRNLYSQSDDAENNWKVEWKVYDEDGRPLSQMERTYGDTDWYQSDGRVYLEDCQCLVFAEYSDVSGFRLIFWDLRQADGENFEALDIMEPGELSKPVLEGKVAEKVAELEEKYEFRIHCGEDCPESFVDYIPEPETDPDLILYSLEQLEIILERFPEGFVQQLPFGSYHQLHIYLTGTLTGNGDYALDTAGGLVNEEDGQLILAADIRQSYSLNTTFSHELSHVIERKLEYRSRFVEDAVFSEQRWESYNPDDFAYRYSYTDAETSDEYYCYQPGGEDDTYFIDSYSTTYPTEDRARIFEYAMTRQDMDAGYFDYSPIREKLKYYSEAIRDGMDTEGWPEVTVWEECCQQEE